MPLCICNHQCLSFASRFYHWLKESENALVWCLLDSLFNSSSALRGRISYSSRVSFCSNAIVASQIGQPQTKASLFSHIRCNARLNPKQAKTPGPRSPLNLLSSLYSTRPPDPVTTHHPPAHSASKAHQPSPYAPSPPPSAP